ncbi:HprK-related kinase A [uncultured Paraglaciecola sp.]|uniref:HprK-related kinase A n=1 Tax=uncultured Paraglaciecola sp. TaxID=1765024 RepID=UPI002604887E|nr:HprK-related kinase A [uncultured Paraglaciecola sp.]
MLINTGLYTFEVKANQHIVQKGIDFIYGDAAPTSNPPDFCISLKYSSILRSIIKPQVSFYCDQHSPFKPLNATQAYALLEWGLNWCIAAHDYTRLIVHAAVLVKNNKAIIFPARPGSGKSTLTAYLALSGWRLYSDEMAIIELESGLVNPLYRPVCLKNDSIDLVKTWFPKSQMTTVCKDTQKGDVAHLKGSSWRNFSEYVPVEIVGVVFPKYNKHKELTIYQLDQLDAFKTLSENAFNYGVIGYQGFKAVDRVIKKAALFEIEYNDLSDVESFLLEELIR